MTTIRPPPSQTVRVLVVDDTAFYRRVLTRAVARIPRASVVGIAADGLSALEKLEQIQVDFVVLDIEMPNLGGLETLSVIRQRWPEVGVVVVSGLGHRAAELTVEALSRGALDFVPKGGGPSVDANEEQLAQSLVRVVTTFRSRRALSHLEAASRPRQQSTRSRAVSIRPCVTSKFHAIALATSTGGPPVLVKVLRGLPASLGVPVFIVQHMPPAFTHALARQLDKEAGLRVCEAQDGQLVEPGVAYVAPGGRHMVARASGALGQVSIGVLPPLADDLHHPSADVLFRSLASAYRGHVVVAVLTGMGDDGTAGVRLLKQRGASCLTQTQQSCVVYGMPRAVDNEGLSDEQLDPQDMGVRLANLVHGEAEPRPRTEDQHGDANTDPGKERAAR